MIRRTLGFAVALICSTCPGVWSQESAEPADDAALRKRVQGYVEAFNKHDAAAVASYWTADGVSVDDETGTRTAGRASLQQRFAEFFRENPAARLSGQVDGIRRIRPDVVTIDGRTTLFLDEDEPVDSAFSAVMVQEKGEWLISSSHEHDLPASATPYEALKELEWLVGTWRDQTDAVQVDTTVRWSSQKAFLIRSFRAQYADEELLEGTQLIGWDPRNKQIRTWTFYSDGTFGEGTAARHDADWVVKISHVLSDGRVSAATQVMTRVDDNTLTVQTIGETVDGEPIPVSEPVTVVRSTDAAPRGGGATPGSAGQGARR